ncbi:PIN domain-containing protein [Candidatus Woesearchaeota archaeon]|nr:PIN domain-containing protein [Candidatus Woesearchaeota archaeon]
MRYVVDTYAWIEYFNGSSKGKIFEKILLTSENELLTIQCSLAEIINWALREETSFEEAYKVIRANSTIITLSDFDWIDAGKERFQQRKTQKDFGLIDAVLLVKQKQYNAKLISGDKHFKNLKNVIFLA